MNIASKAVVRWLLSRASSDSEEIEDFISSLGRGVEKKEQDAVGMLTGFLARAYQESRNDADADDIEQLITLHFRLEALDKDEQTVVALQEIRRLIDLPSATGLEARIRSWGMASQLKNIISLSD